MAKYSIGLDFGTLSGRALLLNLETGEELASAVCDYPHGVMDREMPWGEKLPPDWALIGEIGLTGEVRAVNMMDRRLAECARMGFTHLIVPRTNLRALRIPEGLDVRGVATLREALALLF